MSENVIYCISVIYAVYMYKIYIYKLMQRKLHCGGAPTNRSNYIHWMIIFLCGALRPPRRLKFEDCKLSHASDYLRTEKNAVKLAFRFMLYVN